MKAIIGVSEAEYRKRLGDIADQALDCHHMVDCPECGEPTEIDTRLSENTCSRCGETFYDESIDEGPDADYDADTDFSCWKDERE